MLTHANGVSQNRAIYLKAEVTLRIRAIIILQLLVPGCPRAGQEGQDNGNKVSLYSYKVFIISGCLSVYVYSGLTKIHQYTCTASITHYTMRLLIREIIIDCNYAPNVLPPGHTGEFDLKCWPHTDMI